MINLNVRKLEDAKGVDGRGACSPARLPWAPDVQIPQDKQRNSWVSYTPPSARAASPITFQRHLYIRKSDGRQERSPVFLSAATAPLCPGAAWKAAAAPVCVHGGAEPGGSCSCTGLSPQHGEPRAHEPAESRHSVQLVTFCLEREALASAETRSALDASCKAQQARASMHDLAHRPSLAMEETCRVVKPSARRTLQLSIPGIPLSWSQTTRGREGKWEP